MGPSWSPELTLNHEELDADHVELFRRLAAAADALDRGPREVATAIAGFAEALLAHLAREEALMDEAAYPERAPHRTAHELFLADLARARADLAANGCGAAAGEWVRARAPEWLRFHIAVNDAPLVAWLARRRDRPVPRDRAARRLS
jgi:hemerythrin-like metal-binding protein